MAITKITKSNEQGVLDQDLDSQVGRAVRSRRKQSGLTLAELSDMCGISTAMISRIENGHSSASLASLGQIAEALSVPVISLFEYTLASTDINFVRANQGLNTVRVTPEDTHSYRILGTHHSPAISFTASQVILSRGEGSRFSTYKGEGFIFILAQKGSARYRCGDQVFEMKNGDSLSFDARLSNGIDSLLTESFTFVSVFARTP
jgi:transcriptional regulator with XRE-family HTH domain